MMEASLLQAAREIELCQTCATSGQIAEQLRVAAGFMAGIQSLEGHSMFSSNIQWRSKIHYKDASNILSPYRLVQQTPSGHWPVRLSAEGVLFACTDSAGLTFAGVADYSVHQDALMLELVKHFPFELGASVANTYAQFNNLPAVRLIPSPPQVVAALCSANLYVAFLDDKMRSRIYMLLTPTHLIQGENGELLAAMGTRHMVLLEDGSS